MKIQLWYGCWADAGYGVGIGDVDGRADPGVPLPSVRVDRSA